jgi:hypothetical protein
MWAKHSHLLLEAQTRSVAPQPLYCTSNWRRSQRRRNAVPVSAQIDGLHGSSSQIQSNRTDQQESTDAAPYLRSRLTRRMNLNLAIEEGRRCGIMNAY